MTIVSFNTQPPEGGCKNLEEMEFIELVSTHSRLKAADFRFHTNGATLLFQHTAA